MAQIASALESMLQVLNKNGSADMKNFVEGLYEDMINGEEFDTSDFYQIPLQGLAFGNEIYRCDFDYENNIEIRAEMEILNAATVNSYSEQGDTLDDITMDLFGLFIPGDSDSDSSGDFVNYIIEEIVDSIKAQYDPGKILKDGDIRISTQTMDQIMDQGYYTHFFFRGSEFLYSINTMTGEVVYGENYDRILAEMLQESIDQMPYRLKPISFVYY